ncbi:transcriptional regulator [Candidatus Parcubacteria bacterium]|nr:MAG: transcriptional regulator [Candidatus Parcubacteria bacterium]
MRKTKQVTASAKTARQLERYFKGAANHHRISILLLVAKAPDISLDDIAEQLGGNIKTISAHTRKLSQAGLLNKRYLGRTVLHSLSPYGRRFYRFIKSFK